MVVEASTGAPAADAPGRDEGDVRFAFAEPRSAKGAAAAATPGTWRGVARHATAQLRPGGPGAAASPLSQLEALALAGDAAAPVVLERDDGASRLEATAVRLDARGAQVRLVAEGRPATARLAADLTGEAPWRVSARLLRARLDRRALDAAARAHADSTELDGHEREPEAEPVSSLIAGALAAAELEGEVDLAREGADGPSRHLALRGERLTWSRARRQLDLAGAPGAVTIGEATLRAPALSYGVATGRLDAAGPCALEVPGAEGRGAVTLHAARAAGHLDPRPAAWRLAAAARREARRAGAGLVLPAWLRSLTLEGDGAQRVRAVGPDGLAAAADRVTWDAAAGLARLETWPGAAPVRLALGGGALEAPRVRVWPTRGPGRARALVAAEGGVRLRGRLPAQPDGAPPLEATCDWLSVEVWEPLRGSGSVAPTTSSLPIGRVLAGGADGVSVDAVMAGEAGQSPVPLRLRATRLEGDGGAETLHLIGAPGRPVRLERGDVRLEAPLARLGLLQGREAVRAALDGPWTCRLPARAGEMPGRVEGAGPLELVLCTPTQGGARPQASPREPTGLMRLLLALEARGGLEVITPTLRARADSVILERPGELVLRGDPVEVTRGTLRSRGLEQVLRLEELTNR